MSKPSLRIALCIAAFLLPSCGQSAAADIGTGYRKEFRGTVIHDGPRTPRRPRLPASRLRSAPRAVAARVARVRVQSVKPVGVAPKGSVPARIAAAWPGANKLEAVAVAKCESGFNPSARSGPYLGLFQADSSFRRSYGYGPSVEAQTLMAWRGYQARGWQPWPNCGKARFGSR